MATDYIYIALRKSPELLKLFDLSSDFLVYGAICLFYATFLILGLQKKKFNTVLLIEVTMGIFIALVLPLLLKNFFPSVRPISYYFPDTQLLNSFPSQHVMMMATLAFIIMTNYVELGIVLLLTGVLVSILRWVSLMHWPLDIFAGWILGFLVASAIVHTSKLLLGLRREKIAYQNQR